MAGLARPGSPEDLKGKGTETGKLAGIVVNKADEGSSDRIGHLLTNEGCTDCRLRDRSSGEMQIPDGEKNS